MFKSATCHIAVLLLPVVLFSRTRFHTAVFHAQVVFWSADLQIAVLLVQSTFCWRAYCHTAVLLSAVVTASPTPVPRKRFVALVFASERAFISLLLATVIALSTYTFVATWLFSVGSIAIILPATSNFASVGSDTQIHTFPFALITACVWTPFIVENLRSAADQAVLSIPLWIQLSSQKFTNLKVEPAQTNLTLLLDQPETSKSADGEVVHIPTLPVSHFIANLGVYVPPVFAAVRRISHAFAPLGRASTEPSGSQSTSFKANWLEPRFAWIWPTTVRAWAGLVVPIPTLPVIYTASSLSEPSTNFPPPAQSNAVSTYDFVVRSVAATGFAADTVPAKVPSHNQFTLKVIPLSFLNSRGLWAVDAHVSTTNLAVSWPKADAQDTRSVHSKTSKRVAGEVVQIPTLPLLVILSFSFGFWAPIWVVKKVRYPPLAELVKSSSA